MNTIRKKIYDDNGVLIKENDTVKVSKLATKQHAIKLVVKYDEENQRWLFYTGGVVPFTLEDLKSFHITSIIVVDTKKKD